MRARRNQASTSVPSSAQGSGGLMKVASDFPLGGAGGFFFLCFAAGAAALAALGRRLGGGRRGSVSTLVSRGMLDADREREDDPYYKGMMRNINTVKVDTLTQEQIEEARKRRAGERLKSAGKGQGKASLEDFSIPENHPWAEKEAVGADDEELIKARLAVKRGLPLESLGDKNDPGAEDALGQ